MKTIAAYRPHSHLRITIGYENNMKQRYNIIMKNEWNTYNGKK